MINAISCSGKMLFQNNDVFDLLFKCLLKSFQQKWDKVVKCGIFLCRFTSKKKSHDQLVWSV
jgi:hypothetical protein